MNLPPTFAIIQKLSEEKIKYVVVGGVAAVLHGVIRLTVDLDIVLDLSPTNITKFVDILKEFDLQPIVPINPLDLSNPEKCKKWIEEKNAKVINFTNPNGTLRLDVVLIYKYNDIEKTIIKVKDTEITVVSKDMLIKMKKEAGRPIDLNDVEKLLNNW